MQGAGHDSSARQVAAAMAAIEAAETEVGARRKSERANKRLRQCCAFSHTIKVGSKFPHERFVAGPQ